MSWILFPILAALIWAIKGILDKFMLANYIKKPIVPVLVLGIFDLAAIALIFLINGFDHLSWQNLALAFVGGLASLMIIVLYFKAVRIEEISRVIALIYLTPLFVTILAAVFLGERFTLGKYAGILLLITGAVLISYKFGKITFGKAFWYMLLASVSFGIYAVITKYLLGFADFWSVFSYTRLSMILCMLPIFFLRYKDLLEAARERGKMAVLSASSSEALNLTALLLFTAAASAGFITLVEALTAIEPFFVLVFAVILSIFYPKIIKEETGKKIVAIKLLAIILIFSGTVLVI